MSENIISTMYSDMGTDDDHTDKYYAVQWRSGSYILHKDKFMEGCVPTIKAYAGEIVYNVI